MMLKAWFAIPFWQRVLGGFLLGALIGFFAPSFGESLKPLGTLFINAIMMLVAPLILCAIVTAVTSFNDPQKLSRLGLKTVGLFLLTAIIASVIGLLVGNLLDISPASEITA